MELICKLAQEKGFQPKTVTTKFTFKNPTESNKLINDMCKYLLLCEIQFWLGYQFEIDILIDYDGILYDAKIIKHYEEVSYLTSTFGDDTPYQFTKYEDALKTAIKEVLESDIEKYRNGNN